MKCTEVTSHHMLICIIIHLIYSTLGCRCGLSIQWHEIILWMFDWRMDWTWWCWWSLCAQPIYRWFMYVCV